MLYEIYDNITGNVVSGKFGNKQLAKLKRNKLNAGVKLFQKPKPNKDGTDKPTLGAMPRFVVSKEGTHA
jgi:hypothetical protein